MAMSSESYEMYERMGSYFRIRVSENVMDFFLLQKIPAHHCVDQTCSGILCFLIWQSLDIFSNKGFLVFNAAFNISGLNFIKSTSWEMW